MKLRIVVNKPLTEPIIKKTSTPYELFEPYKQVSKIKDSLTPLDYYIKLASLNNKHKNLMDLLDEATNRFRIENGLKAFYFNGENNKIRMTFIRKDILEEGKKQYEANNECEPCKIFASAVMGKNPAPKRMDKKDPIINVELELSVSDSGDKVMYKNAGDKLFDPTFLKLYDIVPDKINIPSIFNLKYENEFSNTLVDDVLKELEALKKEILEMLADEYDPNKIPNYDEFPNLGLTKPPHKRPISAIPGVNPVDKYKSRAEAHGFRENPYVGTYKDESEYRMAKRLLAEANKLLEEAKLEKEKELEALKPVEHKEEEEVSAGTTEDAEATATREEGAEEHSTDASPTVPPVTVSPEIDPDKLKAGEDKLNVEAEVQPPAKTEEELYNEIVNGIGDGGKEALDKLMEDKADLINKLMEENSYKDPEPPRKKWCIVNISNSHFIHDVNNLSIYVYKPMSEINTIINLIKSKKIAPILNTKDICIFANIRMSAHSGKTAVRQARSIHSKSYNGVNFSGSNLGPIIYAYGPTGARYDGGDAFVSHDGVYKSLHTMAYAQESHVIHHNEIELFREDNVEYDKDSDTLLIKL